MSYEKGPLTIIVLQTINKTSAIGILLLKCFELLLQDMEETFIQSVKNHLGDRFTEPTEENFRKLYGFVVEKMTAIIES